MLRAILFLIGILLATSVAKAVMAIISKAASGSFGSPAGTPHQPHASPTTGELKKDPVCGTFIYTATAFQKHAHGETYYFCSTQCRDQFKA